MRIFIALDIDDAIRDRISRFMDGVREFAPDARWVRPESLHVTLQLIRAESEEALEFGAMTTHEFFLSKSELSGGGCRYAKLAAFALSRHPVAPELLAFWWASTRAADKRELSNSKLRFTAALSYLLGSIPF